MASLAALTILALATAAQGAQPSCSPPTSPGGCSACAIAMGQPAVRTTPAMLHAPLLAWPSSQTCRAWVRGVTCLSLFVFGARVAQHHQRTRACHRRRHSPRAASLLLAGRCGLPAERNRRHRPLTPCTDTLCRVCWCALALSLSQTMQHMVAGSAMVNQSLGNYFYCTKDPQYDLCVYDVKDPAGNFEAATQGICVPNTHCAYKKDDLEELIVRWHTHTPRARACAPRRCFFSLIPFLAVSLPFLLLSFFCFCVRTVKGNRVTNHHGVVVTLISRPGPRAVAVFYRCLVLLQS